MLDGADLNELLVSVGHGGILREYDGPPDNLGWFREDGSLIAYPERRTLNALLQTGFIHPKQIPGESGGEFTGYKLTDKGLCFAEARGEKMASIDEFFWTIVYEHEGVSAVYIHIGSSGPDISRIIEGDITSGDQITIGCYDIDNVPSEALLLTEE